MKHGFSTLVLLLSILFNATAGEPVLVGDTAVRIDQWLQQLEKEKHFSGGVLVMSKGATILRKGYGWANQAQRIPFDERTLACMGSITKTFTAMAVLKLEEQGKLKVTDTLGKFFSKVPSDKSGITLHQLMTHSGGFAEIFENDGGDYAKLTKEEFLQRAFREPLMYQPGSRSLYSNVGMSVAAAVIEEVSHQSFESFVRNELLQPVGIGDIAYDYPDSETRRIAHGYDQGTDWGTLMDRYREFGGPYWNLYGNGGFYASISAMETFLRAILDEKILTPAAIAKQQTKHIEEWDTEGRSFFGYGCALGQSRRGTPVIQNGGSNGIYFADMLIYPKDDVALYVVTNDNRMIANRIMAGITQLVFLGKIEQDPLVVQARFESPLAEAMYDAIGKRGAAEFRKNGNGLIDSLGVGDNDMILLEVGQQLSRENRREETIALYELYTQRYPSIVVAWNDLGDAYRAVGRKTDARRCYEQALKLRPGNPRATEALKLL